MSGLRVFVASAPIGLPRLEEVQMDWRVIIFAGLASAFSTIACGLFPAWRLARIEVQDSLKAGAATSTETAGKLHLREILVSLEVALSTVLLIVGGLLMLSFFRVMHVQKGFDVARIITQDVSYLSPKYAHGVRRRFVEETVVNLARIPGVQVAAAINQLPLRGDDWVSELEDPAQPPVRGECALANFRFVTPGYWQAMGIPLKMGRFLDQSDKNRPKAVISERAAQYLWPNQNPLGKHVRGTGATESILEVVGVVGEVRAKGLEQNPPMIVYEHYWRMQPIGMSFVVRTQANARAVAGAIRSTASSADPEMAIAQPTTMEQIVEESVAARKFQRLSGRGVCDIGPAAGVARNLRGDLIHRGAKNARDRNSSGSRSASPAAYRHDCCCKDAPRSRRTCGRSRLRALCRPPDRQPVVQGRLVRSAHDLRRGCLAADCRHVRMPDSSPSCFPYRSTGRPSLRVGPVTPRRKRPASPGVETADQVRDVAEAGTPQNAGGDRAPIAAFTVHHQKFPAVQFR